MQPNQSHSYVGQSVCRWLCVCLTVCLSAFPSVCPSVSLHPKHTSAQGLNQRGPKHSRDSKHERESPPNSGHIFWGALSPGNWSAAPLLLLLVLLLLMLLLLLVLHSFVYWHFDMCCKWQPRHMDSGTRGQCLVCSWLVPLLHAGTFPFWSLWQIAVILGHQYLTLSPPLPALWPFSCQCKVENMPNWLPRVPLQLTRTAFEIEIQSPWTSATQCPEA